MTDHPPPAVALDPHGRPLGGQLERDGRLLAAAAGVDLTAGHADNANREYWYDRAREVYEQLRRFGRDADVVDFVTKAQNFDLVQAQNADVVEKVDAAIGHRYHKPGVHYSVPHVAEKAAAELTQLRARLDAALAETSSWYADGPPVPRDVLNRIRAALQGDQLAEEE